MEARLVILGLLLTALAPLAAPTAGAAPTCTPPWSQWVACVDGPCVTVDGPAFRIEECVPSACTPPWSQWSACVDWPCVRVDGPGFILERCFAFVAA